MMRILLTLLFVLSPTLTSCAVFVPPYSAEAIEARVIDAETKQPLEGVVVVAHWELRSTGWNPGGSTIAGQLNVLESVTDEAGRFAFPAWGPIKQFTGELHDKDPGLIFFKPGYRYLVLSNDHVLNPPAFRIVHRSQWSGKVIEMKQFKGSPQEWLTTLERVIPPYDDREKAEDAKKSLMLKAILAEENSIPDSIPRKRPFFDNIVRRLLQGK